MGRTWDAQFTADGKSVVSISEDCTCRVWSIEDEKCLKTWTGHYGKSVWSVAISDSVVATGGSDAGIRLWSLEQTSYTQSKPYSFM